mmetsp:Transcript_27900/g.38955  ORF Transcript_27900/g.38955 Transcript_27900/m.38955 type:complete len:95 (+) Transcript_27900:444-728(+)
MNTLSWCFNNYMYGKDSFVNRRAVRYVWISFDSLDIPLLVTRARLQVTSQVALQVAFGRHCVIKSIQTTNNNSTNGSGDFKGRSLVNLILDKTQ